MRVVRAARRCRGRATPTRGRVGEQDAAAVDTLALALFETGDVDGALNATQGPGAAASRRPAQATLRAELGRTSTFEAGASAGARERRRRLLDKRRKPWTSEQCARPCGSIVSPVVPEPEEFRDHNIEVVSRSALIANLAASTNVQRRASVLDYLYPRAQGIAADRCCFTCHCA